MLTEDMKRIIREQPLGYVATIGADGAPRVSPKATFVVVDDSTIAYGDIRSPSPPPQRFLWAIPVRRTRAAISGATPGSRSISSIPSCARAIASPVPP